MRHDNNRGLGRIALKNIVTKMKLYNISTAVNSLSCSKVIMDAASQCLEYM